MLQGTDNSVLKTENNSFFSILREAVAGYLSAAHAGEVNGNGSAAPRLGQAQLKA